MNTDPITLSGIVKSVRFTNPDNGFSILSLESAGELFTVKGIMRNIQPGVSIEACGVWKDSEKFGKQFEAAAVTHIIPKTTGGMEKYLASGFISGIGKQTAASIVKAFGQETQRIIEESPERLTEVYGIGEKKAQAISDAWREQRAISDISVFLMEHGLSANGVERIFRALGHDAMRLIREDPYILAYRVEGSGFQTADKVAQSMGIAADDPRRFAAALHFVLEEADGNGSCGMPAEAARRLALRLLSSSDQGRLAEAEAWLLEKEELVADELEGVPHLFNRIAYRTENGICRHLAGRLEGVSATTAARAEASLQALENAGEMRLDGAQREAAILALSNPLSIITGAPGTGKTTITRAIIHAFQMLGLSVRLAAPTGRAAKRMTQSTQCAATTLHRLLEVARGGGFKRNEHNPIEGDVVLVDESSMLDIHLFYALLKALPPRAVLVVIGDIDQLPSVGPGNILRDMIGSGAVPMTRLTTIRRQAAGSRVISAAHEINAGLVPDLPEEGGDLVFREKPPAEIVPALVDLFVAQVKQHGLSNVQVLTPMRGTDTGVDALNAALQAAVNPRPKNWLRLFDTRFGEGDKVMQTRNDYDLDIFNGDSGIIRQVDMENNTLVVDFDGNPGVILRRSHLNSLALAFASTIHKYQGSETEVVIMPMSMQHRNMLRRNLAYTGITRIRQQGFLVGERAAFAAACRTEDNSRRVTRLRALLQDAVPAPACRSRPCDGPE